MPSSPSGILKKPSPLSSLSRKKQSHKMRKADSLHSHGKTSTVNRFSFDLDGSDDEGVRSPRRVSFSQDVKVILVPTVDEVKRNFTAKKKRNKRLKRMREMEDKKLLKKGSCEKGTKEVQLDDMTQKQRNKCETKGAQDGHDKTATRRESGSSKLHKNLAQSHRQKSSKIYKSFGNSLDSVSPLQLWALGAVASCLLGYLVVHYTTSESSGTSAGSSTSAVQHRQGTGKPTSDDQSSRQLSQHEVDRLVRLENMWSLDNSNNEFLKDSFPLGYRDHIVVQDETRDQRAKKSKRKRDTINPVSKGSKGGNRGREKKEKKTRLHQEELIVQTDALVELISPTCVPETSTEPVKLPQGNDIIQRQAGKICVATAYDNHFRFVIRGLKKGKKAAPTKLALGWLQIDGERLHIDEDHIVDLRKHVTWRSSLNYKGEIGAPKGRTNTGKSRDDNAVKDVIDLDLRLDGLHGGQHNLTFFLDFGKREILATSSVLFRYDRKFWLSQVSADIISPLPGQTTPSRWRFEYLVHCFKANVDGIIEVRVYHKDKNGKKSLRSKQELNAARAALDIQGLEHGTAMIELKLFKLGSRKIFKGKTKRVEWFVDTKEARGTTSNWQNSEFATALYSIAKNADDLEDAEVIRKIEEIEEVEGTEAVLNTRAADGKGALHWSYEFANVPLCEWLEERGFNPTPDRYMRKPSAYTPPSFPHLSKRELRRLAKSARDGSIRAVSPENSGKSGWYVDHEMRLSFWDINPETKEWTQRDFSPRALNRLKTRSTNKKKSKQFEKGNEGSIRKREISEKPINNKKDMLKEKENKKENKREAKTTKTTKSYNHNNNKNKKNKKTKKKIKKKKAKKSKRKKKTKKKKKNQI